MEKNLAKLPPHDLSAEKAVLGSLLIDPSAIYEVVSWLKPEHFYRDKNRWTYECCAKLYAEEKPINQVMVAHELAQREQLEASGGTAFLGHLISQTPTSVHVKHYGNVVKDCWKSRELINISNQLSNVGYEGNGNKDAILKAQTILDSLTDKTEGKGYITSDEWWEHSRERYIKLNSLQTTMKYGLPKLDKNLGGLHGGQLIYIGARPGIGKTTLLKQFADNATPWGKVMIVSAEEGEGQLSDRYTADATGLTIVDVSAGNYKPETYDRIMSYYEGKPEKRPYLYDGEPEITEITTCARRVQKAQGLDVIVVDYVQLLDAPNSKTRYERITNVSNGLKKLATRLNLCVLAACQLNRESEHGDKKPQLHELRESGSLEQDADLVLLLYRADAYTDFTDKNCPPGEAQLIVGKSRQAGYLRGQHVKLQWLPKANRYGEAAHGI